MCFLFYFIFFVFVDSSVYAKQHVHLKHDFQHVFKHITSLGLTSIISNECNKKCFMYCINFFESTIFPMINFNQLNYNNVLTEKGQKQNIFIIINQQQKNSNTSFIHFVKLKYSSHAFFSLFVLSSLIKVNIA